MNGEKKDLITVRAGNKEIQLSISETNRETIVICVKDGTENIDYIISINQLDNLLKQESGHIAVSRRFGCGFRKKMESGLNNLGSLSINNGQVVLSINGDSYPISSEHIVTLIPNRTNSVNFESINPRSQDKQGITLDEDQKRIIDADPDARILVGAGPGTGKTYVACARVAALLNSGKVQEPQSIWMISFTRTAVQEIRERIDKFLDEDKKWHARYIKIVTLDSLGWEFHSDVTAKDRQDRIWKELLSYNHTIKKAIQCIREDAELWKYIQNVKHLIIDEAQDILCHRAELVMRIIEKLDNDCGVTVFADEAQAIYDFSINDEPDCEGNWKCTLPKLLRAPDKVGITFGKAFSMEKYELKTVHRVSRGFTSEGLKELYTDIRKKVIAGEIRYSDLYEDIQNVDAKLGPAGAGRKSRSKPYYSGVRSLPADNILRYDPVDKELKERDKKKRNDLTSFVDGSQRRRDNDYFVLFRKQEDALRASSILGKRPHRVRLQNLPLCIHPWVGATLWNYTEDKLDREKFQSIWQESVNNYGADNYCFAGKTWDKAWEVLYGLAGESNDDIVDVKYLREVLGRERPPVTISSTEIGCDGPLVGTIHAAKGREAGGTLLYIHRREFSDNDRKKENEESRVLFVGASRARKWLGIGEPFRPTWDAPPQYLDRTQRVFALDTVNRKTRRTEYRARVEIGLAQDINPESVAGKIFFEDQDTVEKNQKDLITEYAGNTRWARAVKEVQKNDHENGYNNRYAIYEKLNREDYSLEDKYPLAYLSNAVNQDLRSIRDELNEKLWGSIPQLPYQIDHLRVMGIRTLVIRPGDITLEKLHEPWRSSGIMLAPVVFNYAWAYWR